MRRLKVFFVDKTAMVFDNVQNVQKQIPGLFNLRLIKETTGNICFNQSL